MNIFWIVFLIDVGLSAILIPELRENPNNKWVWWILVLSDIVGPAIRSFSHWMYILFNIKKSNPEIDFKINQYESVTYFALGCLWYAYDFTNFAWMSLALAVSYAISASIITKK